MTRVSAEYQCGKGSSRKPRNEGSDHGTTKVMLKLKLPVIGQGQAGKGQRAAWAASSSSPRLVCSLLRVCKDEAR